MRAMSLTGDAIRIDFVQRIAIGRGEGGAAQVFRWGQRAVGRIRRARKIDAADDLDAREAGIVRSVRVVA